MADTAVSATTLTAGTVSADVITTAEGGTTVAAGNTAVIDVGNVAGTVILSFYAASAATATVQAGDYPLAVLAGAGAHDPDHAVVAGHERASVARDVLDRQLPGSPCQQPLAASGQRHGPDFPVRNPPLKCTPIAAYSLSTTSRSAMSFPPASWSP